MKRVLCIYLPAWPLQRLGHARPELRAKAVVLVAAGTRGPKIVLASRRAARCGVRPDMPVAEAFALCPNLVSCDCDPEADRRALTLLAKTAERYSPLVGPDEDGLLLDVSGCGPCFGGEDKLLERAARELAQQGWSARVALADSVEAAWALSRFARSPCYAAPGAAERLLRPLPPAALRLPPETVSLLLQLGVGTIHDLLCLPRSDIPARFGPLVLTRLDQALGRLPEPVVPHGSAPDLQVGYTFEYATERLDALQQVITRLTEDLHVMLRQRCRGARHVECRLYSPSAPAIVLNVSLYRPSDCPRHIDSLLRTRLEQMCLEGPVEAVRLSVPLAEKLPETQGELFDTGINDEVGLGALIDRLSSLLGAEAVTRAVGVADPQPEYAFRFEPVLKAGKGRPAPEEAPLGAGPPRPLSLWPQPVRIDVLAAFPDGPPSRFTWSAQDYRVARWWGPERIETGWWRGDDIERDYYVVTTHTGSRFWIFRRRDNGAWFLHGGFD